MPIKSFLFLVFIFLFSVANAQIHEGWTAEEYLLVETRLKNNIAHLDREVDTYLDIRYVPIKFHLVANSAGEGRVPVHDVFDQLCRLNQDFLANDIQFFIKDEFNFIDNDLLYEDHESVIETIMEANRDTSSINVFIVKNIAEIVPIGAYYAPIEDWVVIEQQQVNGEGILLSHQIGHFFSLLHPFTGWGVGLMPYDEAMYGIQAPAISPDGSATETMDQSNCEEAGDFICDTPPDYLFSEFIDCRYSGGVLDPNGQPVDPDEQLIMGYYFDCSREGYYFTPTQGQIMLSDLDSPQRAYLQNAMPGNSAPIVGMPQLIVPTDGEFLPGTMVEFSWTPVANAAAYILEISRAPNFAFNNIQLIIYGTSLLANNFEPNTTYYWRVRPFNNYDSCQPVTAAFSFETGNVLAQTDINLPNFWAVFPNPISQGEHLNFLINNDRPFQGLLQVVSANGQLLSQKELSLPAGNHRLSGPFSTLLPGIYWLRLRSEYGMNTQKLIISD
ncbi:MAG: hypothetical protein DHS20C18_05070 [Saprospiraceae bacterium]|nr:MAG: hypothetical protein DHS20C18_05070 [Saprospiraceae bacterium]